jgi:hypothetical protein
MGFSRPVLFPVRIYRNLNDAADNDSLSRRRVYTSQVIYTTTAQFSLVNQTGETFSCLSYVNCFSLVTPNSCAVIEADSGDCASRSLCEPYSTQFNSFDALSAKHLADHHRCRGLFNKSLSDYQGFYNSGSIVTVAVTFSEPVIVQGRPLLDFYWTDISSQVSSPSS